MAKTKTELKYTFTLKTDGAISDDLLDELKKELRYALQIFVDEDGNLYDTLQELLDTNEVHGLRVKITEDDTCQRCEGTGGSPDVPCEVCGGRGHW